MGYGGATWDAAGTLEPGVNIFDTADATGEDDMEFYTQEAFWKYTPETHQEVRITLPTYDYYSFLMHTGDSFATRAIHPAEPGFPVRYWLTAGVEYHLVVGNLSVLTDLVYEVTLDEITALSTTPWYSDLRDRTDNLADWSTHEDGTVMLTHRSRSSLYGITREIDSPPLDGLSCGWLHAHYGESDVIIWDGFCPAVIPGNVPSADPHPPYADADYDALHGGNAQDILSGYAIHMYQAYDELGPLGVLDVPEPLDHGLTFPRWVVEYEQEKPDLRSVAFKGEDEPPLEPPDLLIAYAVDIAYRDEHVPPPPPPPKVLPFSFDEDTGEYGFWPKGTLSPDTTFDGDENWVTLATDPDWEDYFFPAAGQTWARGDWVFGAAMVHNDPDTGPEIERPTFGLRARLSLKASRYRFVYKPETRPFPPRRLGPRHNMTTAARGVGGRDNIQDGPRGSIGGVT